MSTKASVCLLVTGRHRRRITPVFARAGHRPRLTASPTHLDADDDAHRISIAADAGRRPVSAQSDGMAAANRPVAELGRSRCWGRTTASWGTAEMYAVVAIDTKHLDVPVSVEPVSHGSSRTKGSPTSGRVDPGITRMPAPAAAAAALSAVTATQRGLERPSELERHDVVEDRVDDRTDVVENAGGVEEDRLEHLAGGGALLGVVWAGVDGDKSLSVERGPADEESHHHRHCNVTTPSSYSYTVPRRQHNIT